MQLIRDGRKGLLQRQPSYFWARKHNPYSSSLVFCLAFLGQLLRLSGTFRICIYQKGLCCTFLTGHGDIIEITELEDNTYILASNSDVEDALKLMHDIFLSFFYRLYQFLSSSQKDACESDRVLWMTHRWEIMINVGQRITAWQIYEEKNQLTSVKMSGVQTNSSVVFCDSSAH